MEVKECIKHKDWTNKEGKTLPIYKVTLTDGTFGESFSEIPIGTNISDITIEEGQYGKKFRLNKKNGFRPAQPKGNESFALSYAKDYAVAIIANGQPFKSDLIIELAEKFYTWLESKKK
jgi:hypothetical protein